MSNILGGNSEMQILRSDGKRIRNEDRYSALLKHLQPLSHFFRIQKHISMYFVANICCKSTQGKEKLCSEEK